MKKAKVIPIYTDSYNASSPPCRFRSSCPVYINNIDEDPVAAIYSIITASGRVVNGAYKIKRHHLDDLQRALDLLTIRLHSALAA